MREGEKQEVCGQLADYVDFWNCLNKKKPSGISTKFSNGEIRSRLADAGIQSGFFTVTVGGKEITMEKWNG